jgi:hypothetical protein
MTMTDIRPHAAMAGTLEAHIAALLAQGLEVTFSADANGTWANVDPLPGQEAASGFEGCTAGGRTPLEALQAASPLLSDDAELPAPAGEDDVRTLSGDMDDVLDRLEALEADRDGRERDMRALIRVIADLHAQLHPDGLVAQRGDKPGTADSDGS